AHVSLCVFFAQDLAKQFQQMGLQPPQHPPRDRPFLSMGRGEEAIEGVLLGWSGCANRHVNGHEGTRFTRHNGAAYVAANTRPMTVAFIRFPHATRWTRLPEHPWMPSSIPMLLD